MTDAAPFSRWSASTKLLVLAVACAIAIVCQALVGEIGRRTGDPPPVLFWSGLAFMYGVGALVLALRGLTKHEAAFAVVLMSLSMQVTRFVLYPNMFVYHDELQHVRALEAILSLHRLFTHNSTLPVSASFPGLETATSCVAMFTGLSAHTSGVIVLLVARLILSLALFLIFHRLLRSTRAAGIASLIYLANPQYLFFNSQYSYQTLAISMSFGYVLLLVALNGVSRRNAALWLVPTAIAIAATHHLTSWGLTALLSTWLLVSGYTRRRPRHLVIATVSIAASVVVWSVLQRHILFPYLYQIVREDVHSLVQLLEGHTTHTFFKTTTEDKTPVWERYASLASVLVLVVVLPLALVSGRRWVPARWAPAIVLGLIAAVYPLLPLGHLTNATSDVADRSSGFVFAGIAFVIAAWPSATRSPRLQRIFHAKGRAGGMALFAFLLGGLVLFVGGTIVGSGPPSLRDPGKYIVEGENRSVDEFAVAAARWEGRYLPPYRRTFSDRTNALLSAVLGDQHSVSALADGISTYNISLLLLAPPSQADVGIARRDRVQYLVVDTRITTALPDVGIYIDTGEYGSTHRTHPPRSAVTKFNFWPGVNRIYDNGTIRIYDLRMIR